MSRLKDWVALTLLVIVGLAIGSVPTAPQGSVAPAVERDISVYRGLGTWVDIFDARSFSHPAQAVQEMGDRGVRTLYIETSNYSRPYAVFRPTAQSVFIETAHSLGIDVVAWYLPGFANLSQDLERSLAAIRFQTTNGQHFDGFGLDIEASIVQPPSARSKALLRLSARIRDGVPDGYALGAIIPSPSGMQEVKGYWPGFPYEGLTRYYDVIVPMSYSAYRAHGEQETHDYTANNIDIIREETGTPEIPIHVIGGIAQSITQREARGFVHAVREHGVAGASLYDFLTTTAEAWSELAAVPVNPRQSLALPVDLTSPDELGNLPGGDQGHPKEVFYRAGGLAGDHSLSFEAFDAQAGEVSVWVNWRKVADVATTAKGVWGLQQQVKIEDRFLNDSGDNLIQFEASGNWPDWSIWGVRNVTLP